MSTPANPFWGAVQNWMAQANTYWTKWKAQGMSWRSMFWQRFQGPAPVGAIGPLRTIRMNRMNMMGRGQRAPQRVQYPIRQYGRVMPHVIDQPGLFPPAYHETYDYTYKSPNQSPPFTTSRRLGVEGEKYDFTF